MSVFVLAKPAPPYVAPPPPAKPFHRARMEWVGVDGSRWDLTDPRSGLFVTKDGLEGMHLPPWLDYTSEAVRVAGQRSRGGKWQPRAVEWPIYLWADSSSAYAELENAWWRSLSTTMTGTWRVTTPDGQTRNLTCRMLSDGNYAYDHDPLRVGWCRYPVSLVADDPFWYGDPVTVGWRNITGAGMFTDGWITVTSNGGTDNATISNPGDEDAWLQWKITVDAAGSISTGILTVAGGQIGIPALAAGDVLYVDTDPAVGTGFNGSIDVSGQIDPWDPRPIPGHGTEPVGFDISGTGWTVEASIPARHWRAL